MTAKHRIAAVQMVSGPTVPENLAVAGDLIAQAAARGARLIVLPEYFAILGLRDEDKVTVREREGAGPIQDFLADAARRHGIWLVGGSAPLADKIHLFGFDNGTERYQESRTIEPGAAVEVLDTPFGRVGLSICYDLRFPELYRAMQPVDLILVPSAFTATTGRAHWETLLRARAIENLAYVLAAAQGGLHANGRETHGDSMIIDPWGAVVDRLAKGPGVVVADMDLAFLRRMRANLPALEHRTLGRARAPGG
jgi:predicted amidohydrolase